MTILGICGSPRKGNTQIVLDAALTELSRSGCTSEAVLLKDSRLNWVGTKGEDDFERS